MMMNASNLSYLELAMVSHCDPPAPSYHDHLLAKASLAFLYGLVFVMAVCGNILVIYAVAANKCMQSVTNLFIANLGVSDILVNLTSLWLTPLYAYMNRWVWGSVMCHLVPLIQGMSTFISALTLMAIAIDRYVAILYPFRARISRALCGTIVAGIWTTAFLLVMPLAIQMELYYDPQCQLYICQEQWTDVPELRVAYGFVVLSLQFGLPFIVIAYCYVRIWLHLMFRRSMVATTARYSSDERRKGRLVKMLVAMVVIYLLAWLPVNSLNVLRDATNISEKEYFVILFLFAHLCSMSATCWNPVVYAWMNENFRQEFKALLPCFKYSERYSGRSRSISVGEGRKSIQSAAGSELRSLALNRPSVLLIDNAAQNRNDPGYSPSIRRSNGSCDECCKLVTNNNDPTVTEDSSTGKRSSYGKVHFEP